MPADLADLAPTPAALLDEVRAARRVADDAERLILFAAVEWAHAHPALEPGDRSWHVKALPGFGPDELDARALAGADAEGVEWFSIPPVAWDAPAAFAAANHQAESAGKALMRDALVLCHRMPRTWARVEAGQVPAWRARRIAAATLGRPGDVVAALDRRVAPVAESVGPITLDRLVDEELQRLHAEERELESEERLDEQYVRLDPHSINHTGIAEMHLRADWKDLHDFDTTVAAVAEALRHQGCTESLDRRRALAIGILADPDQADALLRAADDGTGDGSDGSPRRKQVALVFHLGADAVTGCNPVGRNATTGRAELAELIRGWCGRDDTHLTVLPVRDLAQHHHVEAYEVPDRLREQTFLLHGTCVYPWCTRAAKKCDCDHIVAHADGGPTCSCNVAPLCRHHHLLKTHSAWTYRRIDETTFVWTDPYGHHYLRQQGRTHVVEDRHRPGAATPRHLRVL